MGRIKLRLARIGPKNYKQFNIVATDTRKPRDSGYKEIVGRYNPNPDEFGTKFVELKADRIKYWVAVGAEMSDTVAYILGKSGLIPPPPERFQPIKDQRRKEKAEVWKREYSTYTVNSYINKQLR